MTTIYSFVTVVTVNRKTIGWSLSAGGLVDDCPAVSCFGDNKYEYTATLTSRALTCRRLDDAIRRLVRP